MHMSQPKRPPGDGPSSSSRIATGLLGVGLTPDPEPSWPQLSGDDLPPSYTFLLSHMPQAVFHLLLLVEYASGDTAVISDVGTAEQPDVYATATSRGEVRLIDTGEWPFEVGIVTASGGIRTIVPVVYSSPRNLGYSFEALGVALSLYSGAFDVPPPRDSHPLISYPARNRETEVAFYVPMALHLQSPSWSTLNAYSRPGSLGLPTVRYGQVYMDSGPTMAP